MCKSITNVKNALCCIFVHEYMQKPKKVRLIWSQSFLATFWSKVRMHSTRWLYLCIFGLRSTFVQDDIYINCWMLQIYINLHHCKYSSTAGCKYILTAITANIYQLLDANIYKPLSLQMYINCWVQIYISTAITAKTYQLLYANYINHHHYKYISTAGCKYIYQPPSLQINFWMQIYITSFTANIYQLQDVNIYQLLDANTYQPPSLSPQAMLPSPSWGYNRLTHPLHDRSLISYLRLPPFPLVHILFLKCPFVIFLAEFIFLFEYFQHSADRIFG